MKNQNDVCDDHHSKFAPKKHPDAGKPHNNPVGDHQRSIGHPANHTPGKMPSQLNPDHGPHK